MKLPAAFEKRMKEQLGGAYPAFLAAYALPAYKGLRVNTLKIGRAEFEKISPFSLSPVLWEENGFYIEEEKAGRHPYHFAGLYYLQEPSAMLPAIRLCVEPGERVLDLCAAPGGKSTQLAAALSGEGLLVANEINGARAKILSQNIERLGVTNAIVTNASPEALAERFLAYFDKILVDAPCGGEGMFRKNEAEAIANWSEENVRLCALRQREILSSAAKMLRGGGKMVYSTCTFAPEEDEEQAEDFLRRNSDFRLIESRKIYPHEEKGEGHFYALFERLGCERGALRTEKSNVSSRDRATFGAFCQSVFPSLPAFLSKGILYRSGDTLYCLPEGAFSLEKLPVLRAGLRLGTFEKGRFEPSHALAVALKRDEVRLAVDLSIEESERYLRGETVSADVENGWCVVFADGYSIGWGKAVNGTVKNHYPKGLRLVK